MLSVIAGPGSRYYPPADVGGGTDFSQILFSDDFQSGTVGNIITAATGAYGLSEVKYSTDITGPGGLPKVAEDLALQGVDENAVGWDWTFPGGNVLHEGDEIWVRVKMWFPATYDFTSNSHLKWLRVASGANWVDLYYRDSDGGWRYQSEVTPTGIDDRNFLDSTQYAIVPETWETYEWYVRLHSQTGPGNALVRAWKNGVFIGEFDVLRTLASSGNTSGRVIVRNYWNGFVPVTQTNYNADFAVAVKSAGWRDDTPYLSTDAGGRLHIGTASP